MVRGGAGVFLFKVLLYYVYDLSRLCDDFFVSLVLGLILGWVGH